MAQHDVSKDQTVKESESLSFGVEFEWELEFHHLKIYNLRLSAAGFLPIRGRVKLSAHMGKRIEQVLDRGDDRKPPFRCDASRLQHLLSLPSRLLSLLSRGTDLSRTTT